MIFSKHPLYVGSYISANEAGIYAFAFDTASGTLSADWSLAGIANPSFLMLHPNGRWLYAVSETSQSKDGQAGKVWSIHLPNAVDHPSLLNHQASGGDWPCHLVIDHTGHWLLVSNYASGTVGVLPILENGKLGAMADLVQHHGRGPDPQRQEGPHTHSAIFTPDNRFVIVADLGIDQLVIYTFDSASGRLHPHGHAQSRPGAGPRHMVFHPGSHVLYVAHELDNTVGVYDYQAERGELVARQVLETLPPGASESQVADIHLAPTADWLYVSNRGDDSVTTFAVGEHGQLECVAVNICGGRWPRNFALAPGGQFLLVANQYSNEVTVLPVSDAHEISARPHASVAVPGAACVQFGTTEQTG